jgi:hypothetical protein
VSWEFSGAGGLRGSVTVFGRRAPSALIPEMSVPGPTVAA